LPRKGKGGAGKTSRKKRSRRGKRPCWWGAVAKGSRKRGKANLDFSAEATSENRGTNRGNGLGKGEKALCPESCKGGKKAGGVLPLTGNWERAKEGGE